MARAPIWLRDVDCGPMWVASRTLTEPIDRFTKGTLVVTELYSARLKTGEPLVCDEWWKRFDPWRDLPSGFPIAARPNPVAEVGLAEALMALPDLDRRKAALDIVQFHLMRWAQRGGWNAAPLVAAYEACLADGLQLTLASKPKASPDRRRRAFLSFTIDGNGDGWSRLHVVDRTGTALFDSSPQISRGETRHFRAMASTLRWLDSSTIVYETWVMLVSRRFFIDEGREDDLRKADADADTSGWWRIGLDSPPRS